MHELIREVGGLRGGLKFKLLPFCLCAGFSVTQLKAFKTFSPKFGVSVVVKNRDEVLDQRVWEKQNFRDTQEDLDLINIGRRKGYCAGKLDIVLQLLFSMS